MNPHYLWLTESLEVLTILGIAPAVAIVIALRTWRDARPGSHVMSCVASGGVAFVLIGFAQWMNADIRSPLFFLQLACTITGFVLLGVWMGYGFSLLVGLLRFHNSSKLQ